MLVIDVLFCLYLSDCASLPCQNGGSCLLLPDGFPICQCLPEYYGSTCEYLNPCILYDFCEDRGNCSNIRGSQWTCECLPGFTGYKCLNRDSCVSNPCPPDRTCQNIYPSSYRCLCPSQGYYGTSCDNYNSCSSSPCLNGGKCIHEANKTYSCDCNPHSVITGYHGSQCQDYDPCLSQPCDADGGTCRNVSTGDYTCDCHPGYYGNFCSNYDVCRTVPCLNNGTCLSKDNGTDFTCVCPPIRYGPRCENILHCEGDVTVDIKGIIEWPDRDVGTETSTNCPFGGGSNVTRTCYYDDEKMATRWTFPNTTECKRANLTNELAATMTSFLRESTGSNPSEMEDSEVSSASELLDAVVDFSYEQRTMAGNMMECVSNLLDVKDEVLEASSKQAGTDERLLSLLKKYGSNVVIDDKEDDVTFATANIRYKVQMVDQSSSSSDHGTDFSVQFGDDFSKGVTISLPPELLTRNVAARKDVRMRFTALKNSKLFVPRKSEKETAIDPDEQYIVSADVIGHEVKGLSVPIEYEVPSPLDDKNYTCVYWNETEKRWDRDGLSVISSDSNKTKCSSDHLTYFAVILDTGYSNPIPEKHHLPLKIISHLGTACSIIGLSATILTYSVFKILRRTASGKILLNLSFSLLGLNVAFVVDTLPPVNQNHTACKAVAMLLHYLVLSTFLWMGMEAVNMYRTLVQVFHKNTATHFVLKGAIIAWGLPALPVIIIGGLDINMYRNLPTHDICMLSRTNPYVYYAGYLGPCCLLLLANFVVFSMVLRTVCSTKKDLHGTSKGVRRTHIGCALSVTFLLGITWVLGFFAVEGTTLVFTYLVCIINPMQGFFIFLFRCALYPEALRSWTICCKNHTTNIEKQRRSSSQAAGQKNTVTNASKERRDAERLITGDTRSTSSSKRNSTESVTRKTSDGTSIHFLKEGHVPNSNNCNNNNKRRSVTDVRLLNVRIKGSTQEMRTC
ncbi:adhesion G-protein coupled receptor G6-like [Diadema antillarum]|uniref:adhesion G-protein coupled receptor G6-like n=1 Tax=Diadema antillarum TaxID=105358 RepID=UPI003A866D14